MIMNQLQQGKPLLKRLSASVPWQVSDSAPETLHSAPPRSARGPEGKIAVKTATGTALFDEAQCICPIFPGPSIGDVRGGNIAQPLGPGHCFEPPDMVNGIRVDDGIWSLYSPMAKIPQEINNWNQGKKKSAAPFNFCPASMTNTFANCFSFACERAGKINGVEVATCFCPIAELLTGERVDLGTPFGTQAGQGNDDICSQLPVGATFQLDNN
jgi:hypothetical protein